MHSKIREISLTLIFTIPMMKLNAETYGYFKVTLDSMPFIIKFTSIPYTAKPQWNLYTAGPEALLYQLQDITFDKQSNTLSAYFVDCPYQSNATFQVVEYWLENDQVPLNYILHAPLNLHLTIGSK